MMLILMAPVLAGVVRGEERSLRPYSTGIRFARGAFRLDLLQRFIRPAGNPPRHIPF